MTIDIISIGKKERSLYDPLYQELIKMSSRNALINDITLMTKEITKAHTISPEASQESYSKALEPYLQNGYKVALHPEGKRMESFEFSKLLSDKMSLKFFIGGAFGFSDAFLKQCDHVISLSDLTMSHKIAKTVLLEQIYRGFSILNNHPYHK